MPPPPPTQTITICAPIWLAPAHVTKGLPHSKLKLDIVNNTTNPVSLQYLWTQLNKNFLEESEKMSSCQEKKVQVSKSEESHIDRDFQSMRDRFDDEMRRMESEMSRFRGSLLDHRKEIDTRPMSPGSRRKEISSFVDSFDSPLIKESSDGKMLKLKFDVTEYKPEEIVVKTIDNKLQVSVLHLIS